MGNHLVRDLVYSARVLRKAPGFSVVVIVILALSVGASATVFSVADAWLLKPLNFPESERLVIGLLSTRERPTEPAIFPPYRGYLAWRERSRSFETIGGIFPRLFLISGRGDAATASGLVVTEDFFRTLRASAESGRTLSERDLTGPPAVVLSHGLWERQFGSAPVIGMHVQLNGIDHEIVGIMPRDFDFRILEETRGFDLWTSLRHGEAGYEPGGRAPLAVVARLRPTATIEAAQMELLEIHKQVEADYTPNALRFNVLLSSLQADNTRTVRATLITVGGAVGCLVIIACLNVGTLLLSRGLLRAREAALRSALGSGRMRLLQQFLTESLLLAAIGAACGIGLTAVATRLFLAWNPLGMLPANPVAIDWRVMTFTATLTAVTTILIGLLPALRVSGTSPIAALRSGGQREGAGASGQHVQAVLLAGQIAASLVLLVATTLLIRTFARLQDEPLGFRVEKLTVAGLALPINEMDTADKRNALYTALAEKLSGVSGVQHVAASTSAPLASGPPVDVKRAADDQNPLRASIQDVTASFFDTVGIATITGRVFDNRDTSASPRTVVVNEAAARALFGGPDEARGRQIHVGTDAEAEIVGVVQNTKAVFFNTMEWLTNPVIYVPATQGFSALRNPTLRSFGLFVYTRTLRPLSMPEVRRVVTDVSPLVAVTKVTTATETVRDATKQPAFRMTLLAWFAGVSLLLVAIGVYGLVAQHVAQRRRELGIRLALGAQRRDVLRAVTQQAIVAGIVGAVAGCVLALALANSLRAILFGVRTTDALSFVTAAAALLTVTIVAALLPAVRATRVNPARVLKVE